MATARAPARVSTRTRRVSTRIRRTSPRQGPRAPMRLVERMQVAIIGLVNAYIDRLMREIEPALLARFDARFDADSIPIGKVGGQVALGQQFLETTFRMVDRQAAEDLARVVPVPSTAVLPNARQLERDFIEQNTELIQLEQRARAEVREVITGPLREGIRVEEVRERIQERLGVVRSRAELIARDQTLKLYGQIQEARQTAAGIEEYTWSTSDDERVRSRHEELEGTTQRWDSPPIVDRKTGRRAHPGNDFQCRCAAIPILPAEGLEEQQSPPEPLPMRPPPDEPPEPPRSEPRPTVTPATNPSAAPAERAREIAESFRIVGNVPLDVQHEVVTTLERARPPRTPRLEAVEVREGHKFQEFYNGQLVDVDGAYDPATRSLRLAANPFVEGKDLADTNWNTGSSAKTAAEALARVATHEYGHHIHVTASAKVDRVIEKAYKNLAPRAAAALAAGRGFADLDDPPEGSVTVYGTENHLEFWAEAFTAYQFDRDWMRTHKPGAFALVEKVLQLLQ
jgi:SPP1 gp7 family putative phage head morphogenesis protein